MLYISISITTFEILASIPDGDGDDTLVIPCILGMGGNDNQLLASADGRKNYVKIPGSEAAGDILCRHIAWQSGPLFARCAAILTADMKIVSNNIEVTKFHSAIITFQGEGGKMCNATIDSNFQVKIADLVEQPKMVDLNKAWDELERPDTEGS